MLESVGVFLLPTMLGKCVTTRMTAEPDRIETAEASRILRVDVTTVARMAADGRLRGYRPREGKGVRLRFDRDDVLRLAAERRRRLEARMPQLVEETTS